MLLLTVQSVCKRWPRHGFHFQTSRFEVLDLWPTVPGFKRFLHQPLTLLKRHGFWQKSWIMLTDSWIAVKLVCLVVLQDIFPPRAKNPPKNLLLLKLNTSSELWDLNNELCALQLVHVHTRVLTPVSETEPGVSFPFKTGNVLEYSGLKFVINIMGSLYERSGYSCVVFTVKHTVFLVFAIRRSFLQSCLLSFSAVRF